MIPFGTFLGSLLLSIIVLS